MRSVVVVVLAVATLTAGCGGEQPPADDGRPASGRETSARPVPTADEKGTLGPPTRTPSGEGARGTIISTDASDYGTMLFDRVGQAIYLFDREDTDTPVCYGACAQAWPPVLTTAVPQARAAARAGLLGTTQRRDGSRQVTYNGHPLYFYAHESPDQVLCHNVDQFGGLWLVVTPTGRPAG